MSEELIAQLKFYSDKPGYKFAKDVLELIERQSARIAELEEALKPFAERALYLDAETSDNVSYWHPAVGSEVTAGHLRRARAALQKG